MRLIVAFLAVALVATAAVPASAAPTSLAALDLYRLALEENRLDLDRQGVLFETLDGEKLLSYNVDCPFNPASVVKLATSVVAIERLGVDYRYGTGFYTNGRFSPETGELVGDLVVVGAADPMMTTENLRVSKRRSLCVGSASSHQNGLVFMVFLASLVACARSPIRGRRRRTLS